MQEVTRGGRAALVVVYRDVTNELVDPPDPLVDIIDSANVVVVAGVEPVRSSLGLYDYPAGGYLVPTDADLGAWTARWTGTVDGSPVTLIDDFEVVAALTPAPTGSYVTVEEVRALKDMGDEGKYSDEDIDTAITWFETRFENHVGMAFVPRTATERLSGNCSTLRVNRWPVRSITAVRSYTSPTVNAAFTGDELADLLIDPTGTVQRYSTGYWPADVEVDYVHGQDEPPADIKDVALVAIREKLVEDITGARGNRQFAVATQDGIVRSSTPGKDRPFGVPVVDAVANDYRDRYWVPAVA